jgi:hypothetical protein
MPNAMPSTIATSTSATACSVNGGYSVLFMQSLTAGQVIYVRADGATAVVEADQNFAVPPYPAYALVPCINGGTTTTFSAISSAGAKLYVREAEDYDVSC